MQLEGDITTDDSNEEEPVLTHDRATAMLTSIVVHMVVMVVLGVIIVSRQSKEDFIELSFSESALNEIEPVVMESIPIEPVTENQASSMASFQLAEQEFEFSEIADLPTLSLVDGDDGIGLTDSIDGLGTLDALQGESSEFNKRIRQAKKHGIDIVIVFDSTGSMGVEINAVKQRIQVIGTALLKKLPKARISLVTYRDTTDSYLVRGTPLTNSLSQLKSFLNTVQANGGGDHPEAVDAGMHWALTNNQFRDKSQKAILIFGDAPPHPSKLARCLNMAREFRERKYGRVSTICCANTAFVVTRRVGSRPKIVRNAIGIPEFREIAKKGGGDVYMMTDAKKLMEDILVLAFGKRHRRDVLKFFELM